MWNPGLQRETAIREPDEVTLNTVEDMLQRETGRVCECSITINESAPVSPANVFQVDGSVRIIDQWAIITDATNIADCTNVYATLYDGTNTVNLTADGLDLSGATVESLFTKDQTAANTYSLADASQCRMLETIDAKKIGRPFTVTAKNGATTYIRLHLTTATAVNFTIFLHFEYLPLNGGSLTLLL